MHISLLMWVKCYWVNRSFQECQNSAGGRLGLPYAPWRHEISCPQGLVRSPAPMVGNSVMLYSEKTWKWCHCLSRNHWKHYGKTILFLWFLKKTDITSRENLVVPSHLMLVARPCQCPTRKFPSGYNGQSVPVHGLPVLMIFLKESNWIPSRSFSFTKLREHDDGIVCRHSST